MKELLTVKLTYRSANGQSNTIKLINPIKTDLKDNKFIWKGQQKVRGELVSRSIHSDDLIDK